MFLTFLRNVLKLSSEGRHLNFPFLWTRKFQPKKSNPSVVVVNLVFCWLISIPLAARNCWIFSSISFASSSGLSMKTQSSAYRTHLDMVFPLNLYSSILSIPLIAIFANKGETTPPCGAGMGGHIQLITFCLLPIT